MPELTDFSYHTLVADISNEFQSGVFEAKRQLERQRLITYWKAGEHFGKYFKEHGLSSQKERQDIFQRAAKDLDQKPHFLRRLFVFYRTYPAVPEFTRINWSHYRTLITIPQKSARAAWERRIIEEGLPSDTLYQLVRDERRAVSLPPPETQPQKQLTVKRGRLYTYQIVPASQVPWSEGFTVVDLGFSVRHEIPALSSAELVLSKVFESRATPAGYELIRVPLSVDDIYTYQARIERVVDGDTLVVNIDCGFRTWTRQRLRLKGINAPELSTIEGRRAKRFVEERLVPCASVIIKTTRTDSTDLYGRYLADVFFDPQENDPHHVAQNGQYLNQLLLDSGHAKVYLL
jgi:endonuclease YncB( thermonuclease family)